MCACLLSGSALSQLSDSGQTLSEDSGVDIAESGHISKDSSSHPSRTRHPRDTQGGGGDNPSKPVRGWFRTAVSQTWRDEWNRSNTEEWIQLCRRVYFYLCEDQFERGFWNPGHILKVRTFLKIEDIVGQPIWKWGNILKVRKKYTEVHFQNKM